MRTVIVVIACRCHLCVCVCVCVACSHCSVADGTHILYAQQFTYSYIYSAAVVMYD
jgi:hypothetical protein